MIARFGILIFIVFYSAFKLDALFQFRKPATVYALLSSLFLIVLLMGWLFAYRLAGVSSESVLFKAWIFLGSVLMGVWGTYLIFSIPLDLITGVASLSGLLEKVGSDPQISDATKRAFVFHTIPRAVFGLSLLTGILGFRQARRGAENVLVKVPIEGLPESLVGLKIAQISDLHVSALIQRDYVTQVVNQVMEGKPDLIAVTGDLVDGTEFELQEAMAPLAALKAPLGVFYITGNHEYYWDAMTWIKKVRSLGFQPLINENRVVTFKNSKIAICGVTDTQGGQFYPDHASDPKRAGRTSEKVDFKLLLAHRPESCFEAEDEGYHLQLSGHTHSGQFFPFSLLMPLAHHYYRGLNRHKNMWVYVNIGTGFWGPPNRFGLPSEITQIELTRA